MADGMVYFSGEAMSLGGKTPIPVHIDTVAVIAIIAAERMHKVAANPNYKNNS